MCGNYGTYEDVVMMPLRGRVVNIDRCIHRFVAALNAGGIETTWCCCGHGRNVPTIGLSDDRHVVILTKEQVDIVNKMFCTRTDLPEQDPQ